MKYTVDEYCDGGGQRAPYTVPIVHYTDDVDEGDENVD